VQPRGFVVVLRHYQHRQAQHVGQEDELLAFVVRDVAAAGEELDALEPLLLGQFDLAREVVQVPHQAGHDAREARVPGFGMASQYGLGDGVLVDVAHAAAPQSRCRSI
jgi:hypothetical protein